MQLFENGSEEEISENDDKTGLIEIDQQIGNSSRFDKKTGSQRPRRGKTICNPC